MQELRHHVIFYYEDETIDSSYSVNKVIWLSKKQRSIYHFWDYFCF